MAEVLRERLFKKSPCICFYRTTPEDFGDFLCEAKNKYGVEVTEAELVQIGRYTNYDAINLLL